MPRPDGRRPDELRPVKITRRYLKYAEGSVLIELGDTRVVCAASIEERVPQWLRGAGQGWITAEYGMIRRSTQERNPRAVHRSGGRVQAAQRLRCTGLARARLLRRTAPWPARLPTPREPALHDAPGAVGRYLGGSAARRGQTVPQRSARSCAHPPRRTVARPCHSAHAGA